MERTVTSVHEAGLRCRVQAGEFSLVVDEPAAVGGTGAGPQPTELLLASAASCFTLSLAHCAGKRGLVLDELEVDATGVYDGPRFAAITLTVRAAPLDTDGFDGLVAAAERVCYVTGTLRAAPPVAVVRG